MPRNRTGAGLGVPVSLTFSEAPRAPVACRVKVTLIAQSAPAGSVLPQLLVPEKSAWFNPVIAILIECSVLLLLTVVRRNDLPASEFPNCQFPAAESFAGFGSHYLQRCPYRFACRSVME